MNFDWNLSSDSEEETELEEKILEQNSRLNADHRSTLTSPFASKPTESSHQDYDDNDDEDDDEDIEWEDGGQDGDPETPQLLDLDDRKMPASSAPLLQSLRPVTINLDQGEKEPPIRKRKRATRKRFRLESLPSNMQSLLRNLHRTNLLAETSRICFLSNICTQYDVLAVAHSLLPPLWARMECLIPSLTELKKLARWYHERIHHVEEVRRQRARENRALGAPAPARRSRQSKKQQLPLTSPFKDNSHRGVNTCTSKNKLIDYCNYLSSSRDDDAQMLESDPAVAHSWTNGDQVLLFLAIVRSMGWRARLVMNIQPVKQDLDVDHPLLSQCRNIFSLCQRENGSRALKPKQADVGMHDTPLVSLLWVEVLCKEAAARRAGKHRWIHVDPVRHLMDQPSQIETVIRNLSAEGGSSKKPVSYVVAVEHKVGDTSEEAAVLTPYRLTDVTPRYAQSWVASLRERGDVRHKKSMVESHWKNSWWSQTLQVLNHSNAEANQSTTALGKHKDDPIAIDSDDDRKMPAVKPADELFGDVETEAAELDRSANDETVPSSKVAFQTHPVFVLPSLLGKAEVLAPDARLRMKGVFKGEFIYLRSDVSTALPARKWLYEGRKVKESELSQPVKRVKARKKPVGKNFKPLRTYGVGKGNDGSNERRALDIARAEAPLEDGMEDLYAIWQTSPWSPPPIGPNDPLPVNEFRNIELALLNPGLSHIDMKDSAAVAKRLHIPYAPCLVGFEGHGGNRTPSVRGIVVHAHNESIIREGSIELTNHAIAEEEETRRRNVLKRWKTLMHALLVEDRIEREYG